MGQEPPESGRGLAVKGSDDCSTAISRVEDAVLLLGMEPNDQLAAFPPFVVPGDELTLTFHDALEIADDACGQRSGWARIRAELHPLRMELEALDETSPGPWFADDIRTDACWQRIRLIARHVLTALGVPVRSPDLSWMVFVGAPPKR
jgi:hypothetical protein